MRNLVDLLGGHLARDVAHLLTDVVAAGRGRKCLELRLDVDRRLTAEPGASALLSISPWQEPQGGMLRIGAPVTTTAGAGRPVSRLFEGTRGR